MKKITLIILALTVNVSFAQTILSEDFNSYDSGALNIGDGNDAIFESKANRAANPDCSSGAIPERDDLQILDNGGDKYVAFYDNGINCKGNGDHVAFAAFMNKKLPALTIDTFYTVTFEAWFVSDVAAPTHKAINLQIRTSASGYATRQPYFKYASDGTSASSTDGDNGVLYFGTNEGYDLLETSGVKKTYVGVFKPEGDYDPTAEDYYFMIVKGSGIFPGDDVSLSGSPADESSHYAIDNLTIEVGNLLLSTAELKKFGFSLFPNPTTGLINFKANEAVSRIGIFNTLGQEVFNKELNVTNGQLDISHLNNGIYSIKATINGQSGTMKFIKK